MSKAQKVDQKKKLTVNSVNFPFFVKEKNIKPSRPLASNSNKNQRSEDMNTSLFNSESIQQIHPQQLSHYTNKEIQTADLRPTSDSPQKRKAQMWDWQAFNQLHQAVQQEAEEGSYTESPAGFQHKQQIYGAGIYGSITEIANKSMEGRSREGGETFGHRVDNQGSQQRSEGPVQLQAFGIEGQGRNRFGSSTKNLKDSPTKDNSKIRKEVVFVQPISFTGHTKSFELLDRAESNVSFLHFLNPKAAAGGVELRGANAHRKSKSYFQTTENLSAISSLEEQRYSKYGGIVDEGRTKVQREEELLRIAYTLKFRHSPQSIRQRKLSLKPIIIKQKELPLVHNNEAFLAARNHRLLKQGYRSTFPHPRASKKVGVSPSSMMKYIKKEGGTSQTSPSSLDLHDILQYQKIMEQQTKNQGTASLRELSHGSKDFQKKASADKGFKMVISAGQHEFKFDAQKYADDAKRCSGVELAKANRTHFNLDQSKTETIRISKRQDLSNHFHGHHHQSDSPATPGESSNYFSKLALATANPMAPGNAGTAFVKSLMASRSNSPQEQIGSQQKISQLDVILEHQLSQAKKREDKNSKPSFEHQAQIQKSLKELHSGGPSITLQSQTQYHGSDVKTKEMNLNDGRLVAQQTLEIKHGSTNSYGVDNESYKYKVDDEHLNIVQKSCRLIEDELLNQPIEDKSVRFEERSNFLAPNARAGPSESDADPKEAGSDHFAQGFPVRVQETQRSISFQPDLTSQKKIEELREIKKSYEKAIVIRIEKKEGSSEDGDQLEALVPAAGLHVDNLEKTKPVSDLSSSHLKLIDVFWHSREIPNDKFSWFEQSQRINQFPGMLNALRKDNLYTRIERMMKMFPQQFQICPQSWLFPQILKEQHSPRRDKSDGKAKKEFLLVKPVYRTDAEVGKATECLLMHQDLDNTMTILKQSHQHAFQKHVETVLHDQFVSSQEKKDGKGAANGQEQKTSMQRQILKNPNTLIFPEETIYIIQKFIKHPLLINGYKFDLKMYALVTSCRPLTISLYEDGLALFGAQTFKHEIVHRMAGINPSSPTESQTNTFGDNSEDATGSGAEIKRMLAGQTLKLSQLFQILNIKGINCSHILQRIKDVIIKTMLCLQPDMVFNYKLAMPKDTAYRSAFQLICFELILDQSYHAFLTNAKPVNNTPSGDDTSTSEAKLVKTVIKKALQTVSRNLKGLKEKRLQSQDDGGGNLSKRKLSGSPSRKGKSQKKSPQQRDDKEQGRQTASRSPAERDPQSKQRTGSNSKEANFGFEKIFPIALKKSKPGAEKRTDVEAFDENQAVDEDDEADLNMDLMAGVNSDGKYVHERCSEGKIANHAPKGSIVKSKHHVPYCELQPKSREQEGTEVAGSQDSPGLCTGAPNFKAHLQSVQQFNSLKKMASATSAKLANVKKPEMNSMAAERSPQNAAVTGVKIRQHQAPKGGDSPASPRREIPPENLVKHLLEYHEEIGISQNDEASKKLNDNFFPSAEAAKDYYEQFHAMMENILKKRRSRLLSPAQKTANKQEQQQQDNAELESLTTTLFKQEQEHFGMLPPSREGPPMPWAFGSQKSIIQQPNGHQNAQRLNPKVKQQLNQVGHSESRSGTEEQAANSQFLQELEEQEAAKKDNGLKTLATNWNTTSGMLTVGGGGVAAQPGAIKLNRSDSSKQSFGIGGGGLPEQSAERSFDHGTSTSPGVQTHLSNDPSNPALPPLPSQSLLHQRHLPQITIDTSPSTQLTKKKIALRLHGSQQKIDGQEKQEDQLQQVSEAFRPYLTQKDGAERDKAAEKEGEGRGRKGEQVRELMLEMLSKFTRPTVLKESIKQQKLVIPRHLNQTVTGIEVQSRKNLKSNGLHSLLWSPPSTKLLNQDLQENESSFKNNKMTKTNFPSRRHSGKAMFSTKKRNRYNSTIQGTSRMKDSMNNNDPKRHAKPSIRFRSNQSAANENTLLRGARDGQATDSKGIVEELEEQFRKSLYEVDPSGEKSSRGMQDLAAFQRTSESKSNAEDSGPKDGQFGTAMTRRQDADGDAGEIGAKAADQLATVQLLDEANNLRQISNLNFGVPQLTASKKNTKPGEERAPSFVKFQSRNRRANEPLQVFAAGGGPGSAIYFTDKMPGSALQCSPFQNSSPADSSRIDGSTPKKQVQRKADGKAGSPGRTRLVQPITPAETNEYDGTDPTNDKIWESQFGTREVQAQESQKASADPNKMYTSNITPESCVVDIRHQQLQSAKVDERGEAQQPVEAIAKENRQTEVARVVSESNSKEESSQQLRWSDRLPFLPNQKPMMFEGRSPPPVLGQKQETIKMEKDQLNRTVQIQVTPTNCQIGGEARQLGRKRYSTKLGLPVICQTSNNAQASSNELAVGLPSKAPLEGQVAPGSGDRLHGLTAKTSFQTISGAPSRPEEFDWYKYKFGYSKMQNHIEDTELQGDLKKKGQDGLYATFNERDAKYQLQMILASAQATNPLGAALLEQATSNDALQLASIYEKSGASGQFMNRSPSLGKIVRQARSKSITSNKMKSLRLPSLTARNYVASGKVENYENSKMASNQQLRTLESFLQGQQSAEDAGAHVRQLVGLPNHQTVYTGQPSTVDLNQQILEEF